MTVKALRKQLMAAIAMVVVAAVALSSSTYAWFASNMHVTAGGMTVNAVAENGLVISDADASTWAATANAKLASASLYPTSTKDADNWYHTVSKSFDNAESSQSDANYTNLKNSISLSANSYGIGYVNSNGTEGYQSGVDPAYYLMNTFNIKASSGDMDDVDFYINEVTVTSNGSATENLNKSLRVAVVVGGQTYVFAPVSGATSSYKVGGASNENFMPITGKNTQVTGVTSISATRSTVASIYVFYEGEDSECKSSNITGLTPDSLTVTVQFGTEAIA